MALIGDGGGGARAIDRCDAHATGITLKKSANLKKSRLVAKNWHTLKLIIRSFVVGPMSQPLEGTTRAIGGLHQSKCACAINTRERPFALPKKRLWQRWRARCRSKSTRVAASSSLRPQSMSSGPQTKSPSHSRPARISGPHLMGL